MGCPALTHDHQRTHRKTVFFGLIFTLLGVVIVAISDTCSITMGKISCPKFANFTQGKAFLGDILAICGAMAGAGYLLIGRKLRANMSLISYISVVYGMAAVVLLMIMFAAGYKFFGYSPQSYVWLILLAIIPQLLGHSSL